jgi:hypothetical protein
MAEMKVYCLVLRWAGELECGWAGMMAGTTVETMAVTTVVMTERPSAEQTAAL